MLSLKLQTCLFVQTDSIQQIIFLNYVYLKVVFLHSNMAALFLVVFPVTSSSPWLLTSYSSLLCESQADLVQPFLRAKKSGHKRLRSIRGYESAPI